ncbi:protein PALS1 [Hyalella azteca]|uniref:Protein PALS1 n=1 Tax=Hyalella azteca TaxID=294128 RepID=A0A8B7PDE1_HYAAZ|nr:protein PALS1 [Hyalella azteca]
MSPPPSTVPQHSHSRSLVDSQVLQESLGPQIKKVSVFMGPADRRFGFSVVGGSDDPHSPPRLDHIAPGSPADKADLEVGDEILEVNGRSLEDATHTEVIQHIHQCIRSRTICLRVKRRQGSKIAHDLAATANVQDAFVIAVEQQARERLERLSALKKIKPVDMTKLPQAEQEKSRVPTDAHQQEQQQDTEPNSAPATGTATETSKARRSNGVDSSPLYVTSVPSIATSSDVARRHPVSGAVGDVGTAVGDAGTAGDGDAYRSGDELELTQELRGDTTDDDLGDEGDGSDSEARARRRGPRKGRGSRRAPLTRHRDDEGRQGAPRDDERRRDDAVERSPQHKAEESGGASDESLPATPEKTYGLVTSPRPPPSAPGGDHKPPLTPTSSGASTSSRKSEGGGGGSTTGGFGGSEDTSKRGSVVGLPPLVPPSAAVHTEPPAMISVVEFDPRTREMAVDVPDSFIARTKTPPRYPPPKSASTTPLYCNNNYNKKTRDGDVIPLNGSYAPHPDTHTAVVVQTPNSQEEENRLLKYEVVLHNSRVPHNSHECPERHSHKSPTGVQELVRSLQRIQSLLQTNGHRINDDVRLVAQLLHNPDFQKVLAVHNKVQQTWCVARPPTPVAPSARDLASQVVEALQGSASPEAGELLDLLSHHALEGLLYAHDHVALREPPCAPPKVMPGEACLDELNSNSRPSVNIVRIDKTNEPLGATIRNEGDSVVIGRIVKGGAAEKSGALHEGDEILEVNGVEVRGRGVNDVCDMLAGMTGTLTFIIIPHQFSSPVCDVSPQTATQQTVHVKAHFDYDPEEDLYIPCRELGMSFQKGDILHVISQSDPSWWQAYREGEEDQALAGLIPSKAFQQQREAMRQTVVGDSTTKDKNKKGKQLLCAKKQHKNKKKKMLYSNYNDARSPSLFPLSGGSDGVTEFCVRQQRAPDTHERLSPPAGGGLGLLLASFCCCCCKSSTPLDVRTSSFLEPLCLDEYDNEEVLTYEEVALYYPRANCKRPLVLIGPPNIGRHELRQRLMEDRDRFAAAVPHTSRPRRDKEVDGQDYHFISRAQFEEDILQRKFVEHGEFEKAYYGTSLTSIRAIVSMGKICVLNLHALSLKILKNSDLKPFVVFIAPPSLEKLRQKKQRLGEPVKDEELKEIMEKAREMEDQYGHYFDLIIVNHDVESAYQQLLHEVNMLEREPQWVPATWLRQD